VDVNPVLARFQERFFTKNGSGQVTPGTAATAKFYPVGATVKTATNVPDSLDLPDPIIVPVPVYQTGTIRVADLVQHGPAEAQFLEVAEIDTSDPANPTISVFNQTGAAILLGASSRMIRLAGRPNCYADPLGTVSLGNSKSADAAGWVECYLRDFRYDYTVVGIAVPVAVPFAAGSWVFR